MRSGDDEPQFSIPEWITPAVVATTPRPRLVADNQGLVGRGLGKSFKRRVVLRDVNVSVQRRRGVGLLGPNGAGKLPAFTSSPG